MGYQHRNDRIVSPVSEEQRQAADAMISRLPMELRMEMRGCASVLAGRLWVLDRGMQLHEVQVARINDNTPTVTVISDEPLDASSRVTLSIHEAGGLETKLFGRLAASRPGLRPEDRHLLRPKYYACFQRERSPGF